MYILTLARHTFRWNCLPQRMFGKHPLPLSWFCLLYKGRTTKKRWWRTTNFITLSVMSWSNTSHTWSLEFRKLNLCSKCFISCLLKTENNNLLIRGTKLHYWIAKNKNNNNKKRIKQKQWFETGAVCKNSRFTFATDKAYVVCWMIIDRTSELYLI